MRTQFYKILETLAQNKNGNISSYLSSNYLSNYRFSDFKEELLKTIEIAKNNDPEYQREQESKPTLKVFVMEHPHGVYKFGHYGKTWQFDSSDLFWFFKDSPFIEHFVVVSYEEKLIKEGYYVNEENYSYSEYEYDLIIDDISNYDNVRKEPV